MTRRLALAAGIPAAIVAALGVWGWASYVMDRRRWRARLPDQRLGVIESVTENADGLQVVIKLDGTA